MKSCILICFLLCLASSFLFLVGLVFFLTDHEDKCEMTYMFEYPQYIRVSHQIDENYPKYGLYAYGEGRTTKKARNMNFDGIPVLFIPGNAGSYQQVRSLASVALRKSLNSGTLYHFDYFAVNLNSEFSALYGPVLFDQLNYVTSSIERILELYKASPNSPEQVILIGHSVGGIVAKNAASRLIERNKHLVSILVTLASPLTREPVYFDRFAKTFYATTTYNPKNVTLVSIAGGYSDKLVPSYLTINKGNSSVNLVATNIAKCWVESNHIQIVWCKQLILAVNRALFDSVDHNTRQISKNSDFVKKIFEHHLVQNSGTKLHISGDTRKLAKIDYRGEWIENLHRQYSVEFKRGLRQTHWYMVGLTTQPTYEMLSVLAINLEVTNWVFACTAAYPDKTKRVCIEGEHLSHYSEISPTVRYKRRFVTLNMHEIGKRNKEYTHVVFRVLPTSEPVTIHVDTYGSNEREIHVPLPKFILRKQVVIQQTPEKALIFNLVLPELEDPLQIYQLYVDPLNCINIQHHATVSLIVPWASENVHSHITESSNKPFLIRVQNAKPTGAESARVRLILEPSCTYQLSIRLHIFGVFGQIATYYSTFLISTLAVVFLLAFQSQIQKMDETKTVPIFFISLCDGLKQSWIVLLAYFLSVALENYIPEPEFKIFKSSLYVAFAMTTLLMVSYVIVFALVAAYSVSLFTLESTVHKLTLKLLARTVTFTVRFSDYFMTFLQKVPFIVSAALIVLCFSTCGGLALCVGSIFYFLKLTQMSQDYVEQVVWFILKNLAKNIKKTFGSRKIQMPTTSRKIPAIDGKEAGEGDFDEKVTDETSTKGSTSKKIPVIDSTEAGQGDFDEKVTDKTSTKDSTCLPSTSGSKKQLLKGEEVHKKNEISSGAKGDFLKKTSVNPSEVELVKSEEKYETIQTTSEVSATDNKSSECAVRQTRNNELVDEIENSQNLVKTREINRTEEYRDSNTGDSCERGSDITLAETNNSIFFHSSIFFLWVFITILNMPAVLIWAHNFKYNKKLSPDESFIPGLIFSLGGFFLWQFDLPRTDRKFTGLLRLITLCLVPISFLYAAVSVYRLNYMLTFLFVLVLLQQSIAPKLEAVDDAPEDTDAKDEENVYDKMKMKMD